MSSKLQKNIQAKNKKSEMLQIREEYHGPIPHPNILKQFEEILPGSAIEY